MNFLKKFLDQSKEQLDKVVENLINNKNSINSNNIKDPNLDENIINTKDKIVDSYEKTKNSLEKQLNEKAPEIKQRINNSYEKTKNALDKNIIQKTLILPVEDNVRELGTTFRLENHLDQYLGRVCVQVAVN